MARSSYEIRRLDAGEVRAEIDPFLLRSAREEGFDLGDRLERAVAELMLGIEMGVTHLFGAFVDEPDPMEEARFGPEEPILVGIFQIDEGTDVHLGDYYFFRRLYVREEWRNMGVAHALLCEGVAAACQNPSRAIFAQVNGRLPRLYRRLGFQPRFTLYAAPGLNVVEHAYWSLPGTPPTLRRKGKEDTNGNALGAAGTGSVEPIRLQCSR